MGKFLRTATALSVAGRWQSYHRLEKNSVAAAAEIPPLVLAPGGRWSIGAVDAVQPMGPDVQGMDTPHSYQAGEGRMMLSNSGLGSWPQWVRT